MNDETAILGKLLKDQGAPICVQGGRPFFILEEAFTKKCSVNIPDASFVSWQLRWARALTKIEV
jgi:hypothetical protein